MTDADFAYLLLTLSAFGAFACTLAIYMLKVPSRD